MTFDKTVKSKHIREHFDDNLVNLFKELSNFLLEHNIEYSIKDEIYYFGYCQPDENDGKLLVKIQKSLYGDYFLIYLANEKTMNLEYEKFDKYKVNDYLDTIKRLFLNHSKHKKDDFEEQEMPTRYVIFEKSSEQYFKEMKVASNYVSIEIGISSKYKFEVPCFTTNINDAAIFYFKEGAEKIIEKIEKVTGKLEIIKI